MKSGSLRLTPAPPNCTTVCGTSRINDNALADALHRDVRMGVKIALGRQGAESAVDQPPAVAASISPTTPILSVVAREPRA